MSLPSGRPLWPQVHQGSVQYTLCHDVFWAAWKSSACNVLIVGSKAAAAMCASAHLLQKGSTLLHSARHTESFEHACSHTNKSYHVRLLIFVRIHAD